MQPQKHKVLKALFVRHGETQDNKTKTIAGHKPGKLTATGQAQAQSIGAFLQKQKRQFDHIYVSDLGRTKQTFENACLKCPNLKNIPTTFTPAVRQRCGGILEGKPIVTWQQNAKKQSLDIRKYKCQGAQSWLDVNKRATKFLQNIIYSHLNPNDGKSEAKVLIITHGGFIMQLMNVVNRFQGKPQKFENSARNCSMHEFQIVYPNQYYQMKEFVTSQVKIDYVLKNFVGHLTQ